MQDSPKHVDKVRRFLSDLFFPAFCLGCAKEGTFLCEDCKSLLEISESSYCLCETKPFRLPPEQFAGWKDGKCKKCQHKKLSGLYFALSYKEKSLTRKLIHQFKYKPYLKGLSKTLAGLIIEHLVLAGKNTDDIWNNGILIPVPLDKKKLRIRGYNQSEELAKELAKVLRIPLALDNLVKTKSTPPQMELKKEEREKNLLGAFAIKKPAEIADKKVFLVDDVYTTGSTMNECARVLKDAGAKSVWGITIAREG